MSNKNTSEIKFLVELDENRVPERLFWTAKDGGVELSETKAIMLNVWDNKTKESMRIDLWTKEMMVEEMQHLFYETFRSMADTYLRATNDTKASEAITAFAQQFGKINGVVK